MKVAFLGLGIMGASMAGNLVKAGHQVTTWNRSRGKSVAGARLAATPAEAAEDAEVVWICVSDTKAVESVLFGEHGAEKSLRPGMVVVDSSTISPVASQEFATRVAAKGAKFLDAPITGSKAGAKDATLVFMVGGPEAVIEEMAPLFRAMGKSYLRMGDNGKGVSAKLAMNLMIVLIYEGFAEALTLARALGVETDALVQLIQASMVRSGVVDYKLPFVLKRDFSPNFPLRLMHKDIRLMMEAGEQCAVNLPGLAEIEKIYAAAHRAGHDDLDYAVTLEIVEQGAGKKS